MLRATLSYSKKIPAEQEYSSQSYHLSLQTELPDTLRQDEVRAQLHETFELVKATVESELANGKNGHRPGLDDPGSNQVPAGGHRSSHNQAKATNKQVAYACSLAEGQGIGISDLNAHAGELYGVTSLYELGKRDATKLIDLLKDGKLKAA